MPLKNISLLYVEDEGEIASLMQELLEDDLKELYIARDGKEGLEMYRKHKPDIVLSDIYMPELNGLKMSEIIKEEFPEQPIVLLTAFGNIDDLEQAINIGIDKYISKPIQSQEQLNIPLRKIAKTISDKKELESLSKHVQHQSKYAAIGEVLGLITHQWKQPLTAISAHICSMQIKQAFGELQEKDMIELMEYSSERIKYLNETINDFKDYLKPKEAPKAFILSDRLHNINSLHGDKIRLKNINFIYPQVDITLIGYQNKLLHVLVNIANNACDAFDETIIEDRYIIIDIEELEENNIQISIKDSAGGIDEDIIDTIFEPYFTTKDEDHGTGLGLYMAREFVVGHMQGSITVANVSYEFEGKKLSGAEFVITIPKELQDV